MVAAVDAGELLFAALDAGELGDANDVLDRNPESVDARDAELRVPLHYAADCADLGTFKRIFELNRSLIDVQDQFGFTPLLIAAMAGNLDVLDFLIEQGAQLGQLDRDGHSAVHWAVVCGQLDALIALLRRGAPTALADVHGAHPLHYATVAAAEQEMSTERAEAILHVLLRHGAQLECTDLDGRTPLLWAASDGNVSAFQMLVQAGANRFATDRDRLGVLHCAASHGHVNIVLAMLELGHHWVLNAKDRNADTPLFYAATYGHVECVKLLLERGADPNHQDRRIRTAAHCAAAKGQLRVLRLLRQFGASFELQNYRGDLPFHEAVQMGSREIVDWLLGIEPSLASAPNFYGRTPLHLAAASGNMELVVLLCSQQAPVNPLMLYKGELLTPLDVAKRRGHDEVVDYLMTRHEALAASQLSGEQRNSRRQSIEEQLKGAKLRKLRAELLSKEEMELMADGEMGMTTAKTLRRGKSMLMERSLRNGGTGQPADGEGSGREMVDVSTMVSRRSSSASGSVFTGGHRRVPKSTSTTDLTRNWEQRPGRRGRLAEVENVNGGGNQKQQTAEMEQRIQRIVQQELERGEWQHRQTEKNIRKSGAENGEGHEEQEPEATASLAQSDELNNEFVHESTDTNLGEEVPNGRGRLATNYQNAKDSQTTAKAKKVHMAFAEDGTKSPHRIRRRWTPAARPSGRATGEGEEEEGHSLDEAVTELHILEEGLSPPPAGRMATMGSGTAGNGSPAGTATRYIHERAIFDELTHLKRMQIQYGKVREEVLVRSLVQNFCRMHAINPSHFRRIASFQQWEKFLYDQLKQIYLEERERLSQAAAAAAQKAAGAVGMRPGSIYQAQQRIFASTSSSTFGHGHQFASSSSMGSGLLHKKFDARMLARTNPLDQRLQELTRIYSGGSRSSATSAAIAVTNSITKRASAAAESRRRRQSARHHKTTANGSGTSTTAEAICRQEKEKEAKERAPQKHYKRCECLEQHEKTT